MRAVVISTVLCFCAVTVRAQFRDPNHETTTPDVPGLTAETSACALSTDPTYGVTKENPIKTGGGVMYMAAREVKFLTALRGPSGEGVHFKRTGSVPAADGTILDAYALDIKGERKTTLYLDGYHWSDPVAPAGFLCGARMDLAPPGPDPFETTRQLAAIAVTLGAADVEPPVTMVGAHVVSQAPTPPPPDKKVPPEGARVVMQIFVAADGTALHPTFVSGAYEFRDAAAVSLKGWKFEPARVNTAPVYKAEQVMVVVK